MSYYGPGTTSGRGYTWDNAYSQRQHSGVHPNVGHQRAHSSNSRKRPYSDRGRSRGGTGGRHQGRGRHSNSGRGFTQSFFRVSMIQDPWKELTISLVNSNMLPLSELAADFSPSARREVLITQHSTNNDHSSDDKAGEFDESDNGIDESSDKNDNESIEEDLETKKANILKLLAL